MNEYLTNVVIWGCYLIAFGILFVLMKLTISSIKGKRGELVLGLLMKGLDPTKYTIINNVMIPNGNRFSQIDHIVVSKFGIFVIETKNYKGYIFGRDGDSKWTQKLRRRKGISFYNPIWQNDKHIKVLSRALGMDEDCFVNIIAFPQKDQLKTVTYTPVVSFLELSKTIRSYDYVSIKADTKDIVREIKRLNCNTKENRKKHVEQIKINRMICPKCSAKLRKRTGKYGDFIGCSNYPRCTYSRDI